jgi:hypothetical protein
VLQFVGVLSKTAQDRRFTEVVPIAKGREAAIVSVIERLNKFPD